MPTKHSNKPLYEVSIIFPDAKTAEEFTDLLHECGYHNATYRPTVFNADGSPGAEFLLSRGRDC